MALMLLDITCIRILKFNICCIRAIFELLNYGWIVGYIYFVKNIVVWAQEAVFYP